MLFYPAICTVVFILPVALGVLGRMSFPDLAGKEADSIVPMLLTSIGGDFMGTLILAAGLAALMSTMDSQLLTLSSIFTRDLLPVVSKRNEYSPMMSRIFVAVLALAGLALAIKPPATILEIATQAFTGLAVLFPAVLFGLYLKNPRPAAAIGSILVGEGLVVIYALGWLPTFGFLPVVPVILGTLISYIVIHLFTGPLGWPVVKRHHWWYAAGFGLIFILAIDFWRWNHIGPLWFGLPGWAWYFVGLSAIQTVLMIFWVRNKNGEPILPVDE
jgi:SSS family solute:Na+ symporter